MSPVLLALLGLAWMTLLVLTFRVPGAPRLSRLFFFQLFLVVSFALGYLFLVRIFDYNPNPIRVRIARYMTKDNMIYLGDFVSGLYDLDDIRRIDADGADEAMPEEWLARFQYDVTTPVGGTPRGPWGAAIYDYNECRPPAIQSYELVPVSYDYLAQDGLDVVSGNVIGYADPLSAGKDYLEVVANGYTRGVVTDLNIFRKTGVGLDCFQMQQWRDTHAGEAFPNPYRYVNIGSFRGNYRVERNGATVTVVDRSPFERSQITIRRQYRPLNGSYFEPGTQVLLPPVESTLAFGPGEPDQVSQVYYPEKAVLAFYLNLTQDEAQLEKADGYLSPDAQAIFNISTDQFGLAMPRDELARVLVLQIRYEPNIEAEQLHKDREVTVEVVGVDKDGRIDWDNRCQVTWGIRGAARPGALPYGCEWQLDWYHSTCAPSK
jgi:hypothetical protein